MLTFALLFIARYTLQFKIIIPPDFASDSAYTIPEEWENLFLKRLGYEEGVPVIKTVEELFQDGIFHSISTIFASPPHTGVVVRTDLIGYEPSNPAGERIQFGIDAVNEDQGTAREIIISYNFSHSINR